MYFLLNIQFQQQSYCLAGASVWLSHFQNVDKLYYKNNLSLSLILHLEHNGIFSIYQVSSTNLLYTVQVGEKKASKGIFTLDGTRIYVYIQLNSVVKAH